MTVQPLISIIDDDAAFRDSLELLATSFGFRVASYASAKAFLSAYDPQIPGCVLIDVRMPETSGLALQQLLVMLIERRRCFVDCLQHPQDLASSNQWSCNNRSDGPS